MPGWLEFDSLDLEPSHPDSPSIVMGVGEYDAPWQTGPDPGSHKCGSPKKYNSTYRLETNALLYVAPFPFAMALLWTVPCL